jgi:hypothetical protein
VQRGQPGALDCERDCTGRMVRVAGERCEHRVPRRFGGIGVTGLYKAELPPRPHPVQVPERYAGDQIGKRVPLAAEPHCPTWLTKGSRQGSGKDCGPALLNRRVRCGKVQLHRHVQPAQAPHSLGQCDSLHRPVESALGDAGE